jgi:Dolichyl-phosphate-mannose-protein mannosyltransferase
VTARTIRTARPHRSPKRWSTESKRGRGSTAAVLVSIGTFSLVALVATSRAYPLSPRLAPGGGAVLPFRWASRLLGLNALPHEVAGELAILALGVAGTGFLFAIREAWYGRISPRAVLTLGLAFHAVVVLLPLLISEDVYQYAMYGRIAGVHHANPYFSPAKLFPNDAFFPLTNPGWRSLPAPYGPGFILLARLITSLTNRPLTVVFAFKLLSGAASVATMFLVANMARTRWPSRAAFATALIALNPAVLFVVVGSGHNDALIALLVVAAFRLRVGAMEEQRVRRDLAATACLTVATLIKPPLILLLAAFVALCVLERGRGHRLPALLPHAGVAVGILLPLVLPFLGPHNPFGGLADNYHYGYFLSPSWFILSASKHFHLLEVHPLAVILAWSYRALFLIVLVAGWVLVVRLAVRNRSWRAEGAAYGWILLVSILSGP